MTSLVVVQGGVHGTPNGALPLLRSPRSTPGRVVALVALRDLPVLLQAGQHTVEVVRLNLHPLGHLADRDTGVLVHELQRFLRPTTSTAWTPRTPCRGLGSHGLGTPRGTCGRPLRARARSFECVERFANMCVLFDHRLELSQTLF